MNKFYNGKRVLSFGTPFIFSLGNRSIGKTFYWTTRCIKKYLKSGEQFIYVRRYDNDLKRVAPSFFENVSFKFPDVSLGVEGSGRSGTEYYINDGLAGVTMALSAANKYKSVAMPYVTTILFDEFINEDNDYLGNEVGNAFSLYQTIARGGGAVLRQDVKFVFLGNAVSLNNPYFIELGIREKIDGTKNYYVDDDRGWVVEISNNEQIAEEIANTPFGKMIAKTRYGDYALKNQFYLDSEQFICQMTGELNYVCTLDGDGGRQYGLYLNEVEDLLWVSPKVDPNCKVRFAISEGAHNDGTILVRDSGASRIYMTMKYAYDYAKLRFETPDCRFVILEYMKHRIR